MTTIESAVFFVAMALTLVWDVRSRRIPNTLTVTAALLALVLRGIAGGPELMTGGLGLLIGVLASLPFFAVGVIGGGDVKLLGAIGAFLGPVGLGWTALFGGIVGGAVAILLALRHGMLLPVLLRTRDLVVHLLRGGADSGSKWETVNSSVTVPYGAAMAVGAVGTWLLMPL